MKWIEDSPEWRRQQAAESETDAAMPGVSVYRRLYRLLRRLPEPTVDHGLVDAVGLRLRKQARQQRQRRWLGRGLALSVICGLLLLVVPLLQPALVVLSTRLPALPWPLLSAAIAAMLVSVVVGARLQRRRD